jgi:hypothetical protein
MSPDPQQLARRYEAAKYCPRDRVHVAAMPELGLEPLHPLAVPREPWHEPNLPADVAADPARHRVWQAERDAAVRAWQARQHVTDRADDRERAIPIYAATGCGGTELYACRSYRHGFGCNPIDAAWLPTERLICRDGRAVHAIGDAIGCVDGALVVDPFACAATCDTADSCARACTDDRCRLACSESAVACGTECFDAARDGCVAAGLDRFGLCAGITTQAAQLDATRLSIAKTVATARAQLDAAHR